MGKWRNWLMRSMLVINVLPASLVLPELTLKLSLLLREMGRWLGARCIVRHRTRLLRRLRHLRLRRRSWGISGMARLPGQAWYTVQEVSVDARASRSTTSALSLTGHDFRSENHSVFWQVPACWGVALWRKAILEDTQQSNFMLFYNFEDPRGLSSIFVLF